MTKSDRKISIIIFGLIIFFGFMMFFGWLTYLRNRVLEKSKEMTTARSDSQAKIKPQSVTKTTPTLVPNFIQSHLFFSSQKREIKGGEQFAVKVEIGSAGNEISAAHLSILYPLEYLVPLEIQLGEALENPNILYQEINKEKGEIVFVVGTFSPKKTKGDLAIINFQIKEVSRAIPISLRFGSETKLADINYQVDVLKSTETSNFTLLP